MKRPLFSLLVSVIAVSALQAQPQKQINLGGGFVLNTKIPLEMADQPLNNLFPVEMNKQTPFLSVMNTSEQQKQQEERPAKKEQVRTICGEWVAKDENLISVYEGKDWYIQKSSSCAQEYYSQWKKQQNLSFIQEKQKRLQCEQQLKNTPSAVAMPICPICGKPIDARCGAVSVLLDDNGKKQYTHADCKAKNRFDRQSSQLKEILGINEDNATPIPLTETSAYLSQQAKDNAVAKLKEISISAAQAAPTKVTQEDINAFIAKYGKKLNKAGEKQRKGIALSADDQKLVAQFEALHHAYNAANEAISLPEDLSAEDYVPAPSKRQQKTFLPDAITPQASVQKQAAAIQPLAPARLTADNLPASAVPDVSLPKPQQAPALVAQPNTSFDGKTYRIVTKKMMTRFKRNNKKDMLMIETLATSGASSNNPLLNAKAQTYKTLTESYQYLQTPQGKAALARVQAFEKRHEEKIDIIRQWVNYPYPQDTPEGFKPLVNEYKQILKEGNLRL